MNKNWTEIKNRLIYHKIILNKFDRYWFPNGIGLCVLTGTLLLGEGKLYPVLSICGIIGWNFLQIYIMKSRKKSYTEDKKLEITDEGFLLEDTEYKGIVKWARYSKIIEDNDTLLVFAKGHILPHIIDKSHYKESSIQIIRDNILKIKKVEFSLRSKENI